ncbi:hypothetical protein PFICI_13332 [Pestalotiopsis fici W106-1]|uniref:SWR1-complex protein 3 domain-containing protein n=1 Tax=Pestalotiopsis fici (strain W106-1 / CGMCC3.15140) TaxID=1229662 RepID=W3WLV5_PESFW|nr:uncharacterized protein PFICI_13332 [Pestalotiopsis fici W106-1]ETS74848.1 hypothetical protein PFICI_13332 [Pestalotiopsis fici W106-1]
MTGGERKRKNPPRGAARAEQVVKKRTVTPPERSATPAATAPPPSPPPPPEPVVEETPLPKSVQAGIPLPTVETPQPDDLPGKEYQSIQESGVLAESLNRSRQKWINEGIFEKYWTKPVKRKGVVKEEPNNPPKDSMQKIGSIIITIEPHVLEATMFGIKDNQKPPPTTNSTFRPVMQYGPPNGVMPPPPKPSTPATPATVPASPAKGPMHPSGAPVSAPAPTPLSQPPIKNPPALAQPGIHTQQQQLEIQRPPLATAPAHAAPVAAPPMAAPSSVLAAPGPPQPPQIAQPPLRSPAHGTHVQPLASPAGPMAQPGAVRPPQAPSASPTPANAPPRASTSSAKPATPTPAGTDPIIVTLAEKASHDPHLRDLMKRVAIGQAAPDELQHFQKIIDQITADYKKSGGQQGPSADRLIVDGRTVKYLADEVRTILDVVLASNPHQKASDLKVPHDSDPLIILLVKKSLEDHTTRNMVRRVAENKTKFSDATDLKAVLDRLKDLLPKNAAKPQQPQQQAASTPEVVHPTTPAKKVPASHAPAAAPQQALRSKGPAPSFKTEFSAIVLEFSGGTGDRYLFPKYSILEYQQGATEVLASFLIVRKGSRSEYGGDPALDYYQPMTIRIASPNGKNLDQIARVVAPQDEVKRYMDDVMDNMTRAEYVLLAMRLPRPEKEDEAAGRSETPKMDKPQQTLQAPQPHQGVLWTTKAAPTKLVSQPPTPKVLGEDEQYQNFIASVS